MKTTGEWTTAQGRRTSRARSRTAAITTGCIGGCKADEARASQPHFVSPIVTTHVMLVQQYRYDMSWQQDPAAGTSTANYGASKSLEIIAATRLEVGISPPNYLAHQSSVR